ncbi:MAG: TonB-dependent receptor, partial [Sediminibacterium sp.]|nr:TonB-dependent receptor [Sediminibacterium sp.]
GNRNTTEWGNWTNSFRWNHVYNQKLFSNLTAYSSSFTNINNNDFTLKKYRWKSDILELGLKLDFTHFVNNKNTLKYGAALSHKQFNPGIIELVDSTNAFSDYASQYTRNYELNLYISNEQEISDKVSLQYGLRYTFFADVGPYNQYSYKNNQGNFIDTNIYIPPNQLKDAFHSLEPRLAVRYLLNDFSSLKTSITYNQQNLHLLSNSSVGLPYDIWITASNLVKPQTSWQYTIGYYANFLKNKLNFSAEIYYKDLNNIIDFKDNANLFLNKYIEQSILPGIGRSYGLELFLEKNGKKFSGWISYTYGDTKYKINGVNGNRWFSPRYDIRHNLSIVAVYKVSKRFEFSSTFKITSGGFISFPTRSFRFDDAIFVVYDGRNNYQLPTYHRLDVAFRVRSKNYEKQKLKKEWFFSIYNLYGQENIFALNVRPDIGNLGGIDLGRNQTSSNKAYYTYLFGIVPTITFSMKF